MTESSDMPETRRRPFARLPYEIQLLILRHVYEPEPKIHLTYLSTSPGVHYYEPGPIGAVREWLKPIRLISRLFHDAVTPLIFASIHLHASELSLQRAENIANSPLAYHVREIVHYEGTFAGANPDKKRFSSVLTSHRRRRDYPKDYSFSSVEELYENYLQEIAAGRGQNIFTSDRMIALLQKLPRCITFSTLKYGTEWGDPLTSAYTLRRTGLSYPPMPTESTGLSHSSFVSSMAQWSPRLLNLANFSDSSLHTFLKLLPDSKSEIGHNWAAQLTYLKLGWPDRSHPSTTQTNDTRLLTNLFKKSNKLVHLELAHAFELPPDTTLFPEHSLSNLTCLTLSGSHMDNSWGEETLYNCIKQLSSTLKHLHFQNISLERYLNRPRMRGRDGSLLRMLFNLTPCMKLETCTGLSTVIDIKCNVRMRYAFVLPGYKPGKSVILHKVQEAVCGRLPWPEGFSMDDLPMEVSASNLHNVQETVVSDEAAFIFSSWGDTVDPWHAKTNPDDLEEEDDPATKIDGLVLEDRRLDSQRAEQTTSKKTPVVPESANPSTSKRSRISKVLGLRRGRG